MTNRAGVANAVSYTATSPTVAYAGATSIGDLLFLAARSADEAQTISSVTDDVNAGSWTAGQGPEDHASATLSGWTFWKVATSAGTPTVTVNFATSNSGHLAVGAFVPAASSTIQHDANATPRITSSSGDTTHTSNAVAATAAGATISGLLTNATVTTTAATGETNVTNASTRAHIHFEAHGAGGSITHSATSSGGTHSMHFLSAFKDVASGAVVRGLLGGKLVGGGILNRGLT